MNNTPLPVETSVRQRNSRAIAQRGRWRSQYADLVAEIRAAKHQLRLDPVGKGAKIRLRALQTEAQLMMLQRELIRMDLEDSAYKYVEVPA